MSQALISVSHIRLNTRVNVAVKQKLSPHVDRKLIQMAKANRRPTNKDLTDQLKCYRADISLSLVRKWLCEAGLPAQRPCKKQKYFFTVTKKKVDWALEMINRFKNKLQEPR